MVSIPVAYLGSSEFKSQPRDKPFCTLFVVFLSPSKEMPPVPKSKQQPLPSTFAIHTSYNHSMLYSLRQLTKKRQTNKQIQHSENVYQ